MLYIREQGRKTWGYRVDIKIIWTKKRSSRSPLCKGSYVSCTLASTNASGTLTWVLQGWPFILQSVLIFTAPEFLPLSKRNFLLYSAKQPVWNLMFFSGSMACNNDNTEYWWANSLQWHLAVQTKLEVSIYIQFVTTLHLPVRYSFLSSMYQINIFFICEIVTQTPILHFRKWSPHPPCISIIHVVYILH